jgi:heptaprenyl diphosphate synthase
MKTKRIALTGLLVALAMILSYVESLLPAFSAVPGMKLGLTNLVVLTALIGLGWREALLINFVRIVLVGFTFGNTFSMLYALAGGAASFLVMLLLWKSGHFGPVGMSAAGGVAHNAGQILVAVFVLETGKVMYYLPVLCVSGVAAGAVIGILGGEVAVRLQKAGIFAEDT